MKKVSPWVFLFLFASTPASLLAQAGPEAVYQKWVEASRAGDLEGMLAISSAAKVKEFEKEYASPEKTAEIKKLMKALAPISYQIKKTELSKDGNKASLFMDATARDFFTLNDPKAKPQREEVEVRMVKEGGQWKVDQQCMGKDGCGKEPDWISASFGKSVSLGPGASLKVVKGKAANFKGVAVKGEAYAVDLFMTLPEGAETIGIFLHRSPTFAEFYLGSDAEKITPTAFIEAFLPLLSHEKQEREIKIMEENVSYSQSTSFNGTRTLSLLFDVPKGAARKPLHIILKYGEKKYAFEVK